MRRGDSSIVTGTLTSRYQQLIGMNRQALDVVGVAQIMALRLLINVVENDSRCYEVNDLTGWKLIKV